MTTKQALAKRERLSEEAQRARRAREEAAARLQEIEHQMKALSNRRDEELREQIRTEKSAGLDKIDAELAELEEQSGQQRKLIAAAREAGQDAQREFDALHRDQFAAFAAYAESLTDKVMDLRAAIREPYMELYRAEREARREWNRLAQYNDLESCPHMPLPEPGEVFAAPPPRSPSVSGGRGPVEEQERPQSGRERTYEHRDGRQLTARVGDPMDGVLAAEPEWEVVS